MLPNFLGIGAQRAGTTWVYHCLREHPQIFLPDKKEIWSCPDLVNGLVKNGLFIVERTHPCG